MPEGRPLLSARCRRAPGALDQACMADGPAVAARGYRCPLGPRVHRIVRHFFEFVELAAIMRFAHQHEFAEQHFFKQVVHFKYSP